MGEAESLDTLTNEVFQRYLEKCNTLNQYGQQQLRNLQVIPGTAVGGGLILYGAYSITDDTCFQIPLTGLLGAGFLLTLVILVSDYFTRKPLIKSLRKELRTFESSYGSSKSL